MSKSKRLFNNILRSSCKGTKHNVEKPRNKKRRKHRSDGGACAHLQGFVLPIGETSEGCEEVDVCALDKLLLCLAELLLSLSAPEQGHPCRHSMLLAQHTHSPIHLYISLLVIVNDLAWTGMSADVV